MVHFHLAKTYASLEMKSKANDAFKDVVDFAESAPLRLRSLDGPGFTISQWCLGIAEVSEIGNRADSSDQLQ